MGKRGASGDGDGDGKPKGTTSSYAFFVQACRDEHKKKHPTEQIVFSEFSKKCSERWKAMNAKEKKRFEDMSAKDKERYDREMTGYKPGKAEAGGKRKKPPKDPNAPKKALSAFFLFCNEYRADIKKANPTYSVGEVAKELGKRWETTTEKAKFEARAAKGKEHYEQELAAYKAKGGGTASSSDLPGASAKATSSKTVAKAPAKKSKVQKQPSSEDEESAGDDDDDDDEDFDDDE